jgi:hypothetical protein
MAAKNNIDKIKCNRINALGKFTYNKVFIYMGNFKVDWHKSLGVFFIG